MSTAPKQKPKKSFAPYIFAAIAALLVIGVVRQFAMPGAAGGATGEIFGNLVVRHAWYERGFLPTKVEYLLVLTEVPTVDKSGYPKNWTVGFPGGKQYTVDIGDDRLTWVDAATGPKYQSIPLTKDLLDKIAARKQAAGSKTFKTPEEFLAFVNGK